MSEKYVPKVGDACEYLCIGNDWEVAEVKAISGNEIWLKEKSGDAIVDINLCTFRPRKTPAEIERKEAIAELMKASITSHPQGGEYGITFATAEMILVAGYHNGSKVGKKANRVEAKFAWESELSTPDHFSCWIFKNFDIFHKVKL